MAAGGGDRGARGDRGLARLVRHPSGSRNRRAAPKDILRGAAAGVALAIEGKLAAIAERLPTEHNVRFDADGPQAGPLGGLLYRPESGAPAELPETFAAAEALQFQRDDRAGAAALYRELARSAVTGPGRGARQARRGVPKTGRPTRLCAPTTSSRSSAPWTSTGSRPSSSRGRCAAGCSRRAGTPRNYGARRLPSRRCSPPDTFPSIGRHSGFTGPVERVGRRTATRLRARPDRRALDCGGCGARTRFPRQAGGS